MKCNGCGKRERKKPKTIASFIVEVCKAKELNETIERRRNNLNTMSAHEQPEQPKSRQYYHHVQERCRRTAIQLKQGTKTCFLQIPPRLTLPLYLSRSHRFVALVLVLTITTLVYFSNNRRNVTENKKDQHTFIYLIWCVFIRVSRLVYSHQLRTWLYLSYTVDFMFGFHVCMCIVLVGIFFSLSIFYLKILHFDSFSCIHHLMYLCVIPTHTNTLLIFFYSLFSLKYIKHMYPFSTTYAIVNT